MSMKVINEVSFDEWQQIADKCEYATFFHTPIWSKILVQTYPEMGIATKEFVFDDGTKVILPLISMRASKGLLRNYYSMFPGVYGGVIAEREIMQEKINRIFEYLAGIRVANLSIMRNPLFSYDLPRKFEERGDFTQILKLDGNQEKLWTNYKYSCRKQINKAKRAGVTYRVASDINEWKEYYSIYQEALRRWGNKATSHYHFSLFENMCKARNPNIKLWLVIFDGRIVGGNLNFYHNKHCVEWHASFLRDYFKYGIRNFLVHNIILDANAKGYKYYDFNPSGGHEGTVRFKEAFGTERLPVKRWEWKNPFVKTIANVKRKIAGSLRL